MDEIVIDEGSGIICVISVEEDVQGTPYLNIERKYSSLGYPLSSVQVYQEDFDTLRGLMESVEYIIDDQGGYE